MAHKDQLREKRPVTPLWWFLLGVALLPAGLIIAGLILIRQEKVYRTLIRWRYKFPSAPDRDGWQARSNFGREES